MIGTTVGMSDLTPLNGCLTNFYRHPAQEFEYYFLGGNANFPMTGIGKLKSISACLEEGEASRSIASGLLYRQRI